MLLTWLDRPVGDDGGAVLLLQKLDRLLASKIEVCINVAAMPNTLAERDLVKSLRVHNSQVEFAAPDLAFEVEALGVRLVDYPQQIRV